MSPKSNDKIHPEAIRTFKIAQNRWTDHMESDLPFVYSVIATTQNIVCNEQTQFSSNSEDSCSERLAGLERLKTDRAQFQKDAVKFENIIRDFDDLKTTKEGKTTLDMFPGDLTKHINLVHDTLIFLQESYFPRDQCFSDLEAGVQNALEEAGTYLIRTG